MLPTNDPLRKKLTLNDPGTQLKRGTLEMILLRLLQERQKYGYELVSELAERSAGEFQIKEGTLYPVLYRLEDQGCIEPRWDRPEQDRAKRGVPRKYYQLTETGAARLRALSSEWKRFSSSVDRLLAEAKEETT